jgi:hypothetical protein
MQLIKEVQNYLETNQFHIETMKEYITALDREFLKATDKTSRQEIMNTIETLEFVIHNLESCEALAEKYGQRFVISYQVSLWLKVKRLIKKVFPYKG